MKPSQFFQDRTYENQVIVIICLLALSRVLFAVIVDIVNPEIKQAEVITDIGMLFLFAGLFMVAFYRGSISTIHPAFGIIIIFLLAYNFIQFGGVRGATKFNYYGGLFFIGMAFSNRTLYGMMGFQFLFLVVMMVLQIMEHPLQKFFYLRDATGNSDFLFALVSATVMSSFLRETTRNEYLKMSELSKELVQQIKRSRKQNALLIQEGDALLDAKRQLESEIQRRTTKLLEQNQIIQQFIKYNTQALSEPQSKLDMVIQSFEGDSVLHELLRASNIELSDVMNRIRLAILSDEDLNRDKIKSL